MSVRAASLLGFALGLAWATGAAAQAVPPAPAPPPMTPPAAAPHKVPADTLVSIEIAEPVSTRDRKQGDMFAVRLAEPITLDGKVLVPAGVTGRGQIVDAGRAGFGGKPAKLVLAARYLDWNGQRLPLHGFRWSETGADHQDRAAALMLVPYAGMLSIFIHGGEIDVPAGAHALAKLGADIVAPAP